MAITAAEIAARATEGLDDSLQPLDDKAIVTEGKDDKKVEDDKKTDDTTVDTGATDNDDDADDADEDAEGYTIDEAEVEEDQEEPVVEDAKKLDTSGLTPEQQYIVDNLKPIKVRGMVGDSDELKEFEVYDPGQLPRGFKYADDAARDTTLKNFMLLETRAVELQNDFRNQESRKAQQAFKEQEENADWQEIARLQKSKELPMFKIKPSDPKFDEDPTAQLIEKVLEFKDKLNQEYLERSQRGGRYEHIGFETAYEKYLKANPQTKKTKEEDDEDKDRRGIARRTRGTSGTTSDAKKQVLLRSKRDIDNYIDNLDW